MTLADWFNARKTAQIAARDNEVKVDDSIGKLWTLCYNCNAQLPKSDLENNLNVCPYCDYHFRIGAKERVKLIFDEGTFEEKFKNILPCDPLEFVDTQTYKQRQVEAKEKTELDEAVIVGTGEIEGTCVASAIMDFDYMGGSMGSVVGERITKIMIMRLKKNCRLSCLHHQVVQECKKVRFLLCKWQKQVVQLQN